MTPLYNVEHADEGLSSAPSGIPGPELNRIIAECPRPIIMRRHEGKADISVTVTAYPGTPDLRIAVNPYLGKYVVVKAYMKVNSGANTFSLQYRIEAPVATENVGGTINCTSTGDTPFISSIDISTLGGSDRRGLDGWLNIYLKVTAGTGTLKGVVVSQSEDVSGAHQYCLWI